MNPKGFGNKVFAFVAILFFIVLPLAAGAQGQAPEKYYAPALNVPIPGLDWTKYPIVKSGNILEIPFLAVYVGAAYRYLLSITVIVATIAFIYGAFLYLIEQSISGIQKGKKVMTDAVIGMLLILGSFAILRTFNPELLTPQPLEVEIVEASYFFEKSKMGDLVDQVPDDQLGDPIPDVGAPPPFGKASGVTRGANQGCIGDAKRYSLPKNRPCSSREDCVKVFCEGTTKVDQLPGYPNPADLKSFADIKKLPYDQQIDQYGLYVMKHIEYLRPEAYDAMLKAGEIAKSKGYYIKMRDAFRTLSAMGRAFCSRMKTGQLSGLALPGGSNHNTGVAVDLGLYKIERDSGGKVIVPSKVGAWIKATLISELWCDKKNPESVNNMVDNQIQLGVRHLRTLEDIMAEAGFYHYCQENWHYDYGGVYADLDCTRCAFPPKPARGDFNKCKPQLLHQLKPGE